MPHVPKPREIFSHTGLRGVAAFSVFMAHTFELYGGSWGLSPRVFRIFLWHSEAVDLFFILSGFILNHVYLNSGTAVNWRKYLVARIARIVPLYYITLLVFPHKLGIFYKLVLNLRNYATYFGFGFVSVMLMNLLMVAGIFDGPWHSVNPPSWSIGVEMALYVTAFPLLVHLDAKLDGWRSWLAVLSFTALIFLCNAQPPWFSPKILGWNWTFMGRGIFGFAVGFFLCSLLRRKQVPVWLMAGIPGRILLYVCAPVVFALAATGFLPYAAVVLVMPPVVLISTSDLGALCSVLKTGVFQWLGDISYSVYLWHYPVLGYIGLLPGNPLHLNPSWLPYVHMTLLIALVLAISTVSYKWVENPLRFAVRRLA